MYEVWISKTIKVSEFSKRKEALAHIKEAKLNDSAARYDIKLPDGRWHDWSHGKNKAKQATT